MSFPVSYMGTKRTLAPIVADIISQCPKGPLLDLFSGMCAVGSAVGATRPIWCNDIQQFAATVASALFTAQSLPPASIDAADSSYGYYSKNKEELEKRFGFLLDAERKAFKSEKTSQMKGITDESSLIRNSPKFERERRLLAEGKKTFPYRLFSNTFAGGYLGLEQCIQVDSIRFSVDTLFKNKELKEDEYRWMLLALCHTVCKVSTTTGHFAQYLKLKESNKQRYISQRTRSVWKEWLYSFDDLIPVGSRKWRTSNKVFCKDSNQLLNQLYRRENVPSVIYADPPYTNDQYSRFYHLYETLLFYDYPKTSGVGLYRQDRFISNFSLKTKVTEAFDNLIKRCAMLGCNLVLSYPNNGILGDSKNSLILMLKKHFRSVEIAKLINHHHSSLGASKGAEKYPVTEIIFWAR